MGYWVDRAVELKGLACRRDLLKGYYDQIDQFEKRIGSGAAAVAAGNSFNQAFSTLWNDRQTLVTDWQEGLAVTLPPETVSVQTRFGFFMVLSGRDESRFLTEGYISTEASETLLVLKAAEQADCFFDIGANLGYFSLLFATAAGPDARCHAFEPVAEVYGRMAAAVRKNRYEDRVIPYHCALGAEDGRGRVTLNRQGSGGSSLCPGFIAEEQRSGLAEETEVRTLGTVLSRADLAPAFGLVKIDVEGFETQVLTGGVEYFTSARPPVVLIETFRNLPRRDNDTAVLSRLKGWGYEIFGIRPFVPGEPILYPAFRLGRLNRNKSGNYIAFHPCHRELKAWCQQPEGDDFLLSRHRLAGLAAFLEGSIASAVRYVARLESDLTRQGRTDLAALAPRWRDEPGG